MQVTEITDLNNLNAMLQEVMSYFYTQQKNIDLVNEQDGIQKPLFMVDLIQKQGDLPIVKQVDAIVALANNLEIGDNLKEVGKKINQFSDAYEDLTLILMDAPNVQNSEDYVSVDKSKFDEGVNLIKQKAMEVNAELSNLNVVVSNRQKVIKSKYYSK